MAKTYKYKAFGLIIESSFEIPELEKADGITNVTIVFGTTPACIDQPIATGARFQASEKEFLLTVDNIATYYVKNGSDIIVQKEQDANSEALRLFLLGSALGALLHQRGLLPLHASAIEINGSAIAICGTSGSGKSTIAASFIEEKYPLLTDDICVIDFIKDKPVILPGYPQMKLWADTVTYLGKNPGSYRKIRPDLEKHGIAFHTHFSQNLLPLKHIFILSVKNTEGIEVKEIKGMEKFNAIKSHTYRFNFTEGLRSRTGHLKQSSMLAKNAGITKIIRPRKGFFDKEIRAIIKNIIL